MFVHFLERLVEVLRHLDVLKHSGKLVDIVSWHSNFLLAQKKTPSLSDSDDVTDDPPPPLAPPMHPVHPHPEPLHHVLLYLAVS